ncbi:hypothetical protein WJX72_007132 [[Myrmecia] bisecta]|uniref:EGF-like domain-containing protein n=1 Tax=[Myrmecia] bisecta TaxID=41462 RepID=A0AAW1Q7P1_9CHLO
MACETNTDCTSGLTTQSGQIYDPQTGQVVTLKGVVLTGFERANGASMSGNLLLGVDSMSKDFRTTVYRQALMGFNSVTIQWSWNVWTDQPTNYAQPGCTVASDVEILQSLTRPAWITPDTPPFPSPAVPNGTCSGDLPNTSVLDRLVYVVDYYASHGFYVTLQCTAGDQFASQADWVAKWTQLVQAIQAKGTASQRLLLDLLYMPDMWGQTWTAAGAASSNLAYRYLSAMDTLYVTCPECLFMVEGSGQTSITSAGDGFDPTQAVAPTEFFNTLMDRPYLAQMVIAPQVARIDASTPSQRLSQTVGYLGKTGWCTGQTCHVFPIIPTFTFSAPSENAFVTDLAAYMSTPDDLHSAITSWYLAKWDEDFLAECWLSKCLVGNDHRTLNWQMVGTVLDAPGLGLLPWYHPNYSHPAASGHSRPPVFLMEHTPEPWQLQKGSQGLVDFTFHNTFSGYAYLNAEVRVRVTQYAPSSVPVAFQVTQTNEAGEVWATYTKGGDPADFSATIQAVDDGVVVPGGSQVVTLDVTYWTVYQGQDVTGRGVTQLTITDPPNYAGSPRILVACNNPNITAPTLMPTVSFAGSHPYWANNLGGDYNVAFQVDVPEGGSIDLYHRLATSPTNEVRVRYGVTPANNVYTVAGSRAGPEDGINADFGDTLARSADPLIFTSWQTYTIRAPYMGSAIGGNRTYLAWILISEYTAEPYAASPNAVVVLINVVEARPGFLLAPSPPTTVLNTYGGNPFTSTFETEVDVALPTTIAQDVIVGFDIVDSAGTSVRSHFLVRPQGMLTFQPTGDAYRRPNSQPIHITRLDGSGLAVSEYSLIAFSYDDGGDPAYDNLDNKPSSVLPVPLKVLPSPLTGGGPCAYGVEFEDCNGRGSCDPGTNTCVCNAHFGGAHCETCTGQWTGISCSILDPNAFSVGAPSYLPDLLHLANWGDAASWFPTVYGGSAKLFLNPTGTTVQPGGQLSYRVLLSQPLPQGATDITLTVTLPPGATAEPTAYSGLNHGAVMFHPDTASVKTSSWSMMTTSMLDFGGAVGVYSVAVLDNREGLMVTVSVPDIFVHFAGGTGTLDLQHQLTASWRGQTLTVGAVNDAPFEITVDTSTAATNPGVLVKPAGDLGLLKFLTPGNAANHLAFQGSLPEGMATDVSVHLATVPASQVNVSVSVAGGTDGQQRLQVWIGSTIWGAPDLLSFAAGQDSSQTLTLKAIQVDPSVTFTPAQNFTITFTASSSDPNSAYFTPHTAAVSLTVTSKSYEVTCLACGDLPAFSPAHLPRPIPGSFEGSYDVAFYVNVREGASFRLAINTTAPTSQVQDMWYTMSRAGQALTGGALALEDYYMPERRISWSGWTPPGNTPLDTGGPLTWEPSIHKYTHVLSIDTVSDSGSGDRQYVIWMHPNSGNNAFDSQGFAVVVTIKDVDHAGITMQALASPTIAAGLGQTNSSGVLVSLTAPLRTNGRVAVQFDVLDDYNHLSVRSHFLVRPAPVLIFDAAQMAAGLTTQVVYLSLLTGSGLNSSAALSLDGNTTYSIDYRVIAIARDLAGTDPAYENLDTISQRALPWADLSRPQHIPVYADLRADSRSIYTTGNQLTPLLYPQAMPQVTQGTGISATYHLMLQEAIPYGATDITLTINCLYEDLAEPTAYAALGVGPLTFQASTQAAIGSQTPPSVVWLLNSTFQPVGGAQGNYAIDSCDYWNGLYVTMVANYDYVMQLTALTETLRLQHVITANYQGQQLSSTTNVPILVQHLTGYSTEDSARLLVHSVNMEVPPSPDTGALYEITEGVGGSLGVYVRLSKQCTGVVNVAVNRTSNLYDTAVLQMKRNQDNYILSDGDTLQFTPDNWDQPQLLVLMIAADAVLLVEVEPITVIFSPDNDAAHYGPGKAVHIVVNVRNPSLLVSCASCSPPPLQTPSIVVPSSASSGTNQIPAAGIYSIAYEATLKEGSGALWLSLRLAAPPTSYVGVYYAITSTTTPLASDTSGHLAIDSNVMFTPYVYATGQNVRLTAPDNPYADGGTTYIVWIQTWPYSGNPAFKRSTVAVMVHGIDDEHAAIYMQPVAAPLTAGGFGQSDSSAVFLVLASSLRGSVLAGFDILDNNNASVRDHFVITPAPNAQFMSGDMATQTRPMYLSTLPGLTFAATSYRLIAFSYDLQSRDPLYDGLDTTTQATQAALTTPDPRMVAEIPVTAVANPSDPGSYVRQYMQTISMVYVPSRLQVTRGQGAITYRMLMAEALPFGVTDVTLTLTASLYYMFIPSSYGSADSGAITFLNATQPSTSTTAVTLVSSSVTPGQASVVYSISTLDYREGIVIAVAAETDGIVRPYGSGDPGQITHQLHATFLGSSIDIAGGVGMDINQPATVAAVPRLLVRSGYWQMQVASMGAAYSTDAARWYSVPYKLAVQEGTSVDIMVRLTTPPTRPVFVDVSVFTSGSIHTNRWLLRQNTAAFSNHGTLVYDQSNYFTEQVVTFQVNSDAIYQGPETYMLAFSTRSLDPAYGDQFNQAVEVAVTETYQPSLQLARRGSGAGTSSQQTLQLAGPSSTAAFTVSLPYLPKGMVKVTFDVVDILSSALPSYGAKFSFFPASVTFSSSDTAPQTVYISRVTSMPLNATGMRLAITAGVTDVTGSDPAFAGLRNDPIPLTRDGLYGQCTISFFGTCTTQIGLPLNVTTSSADLLSVSATNNIVAVGSSGTTVYVALGAAPAGQVEGSLQAVATVAEQPHERFRSLNTTALLPTFAFDPPTVHWTADDWFQPKKVVVSAFSQANIVLDGLVFDIIFQAQDLNSTGSLLDGAISRAEMVLSTRATNSLVKYVWLTLSGTTFFNGSVPMDASTTDRLQIRVGNSATVAYNPACSTDQVAANATDAIQCDLVGQYVGIINPVGPLQLCEVEVYAEACSARSSVKRSCLTDTGAQHTKAHVGGAYSFRVSLHTSPLQPVYVQAFPVQAGATVLGGLGDGVQGMLDSSNYDTGFILRMQSTAVFADPAAICYNIFSDDPLYNTTSAIGPQAAFCQGMDVYLPPPPPVTQSVTAGMAAQVTLTDTRGMTASSTAVSLSMPSGALASSTVIGMESLTMESVAALADPSLEAYVYYKLTPHGTAFLAPADFSVSLLAGQDISSSNYRFLKASTEASGDWSFLDPPTIINGFATTSLTGFSVVTLAATTPVTQILQSQNGAAIPLVKFSYLEGSPQQLLLPNAFVDVDAAKANTVIDTLELVISTSPTALDSSCGDTLLVTDTYTSTYDATTRTLTIPGPLSITDMQAALRKIAYVYPSALPTCLPAETRNIDIMVNEEHASYTDTFISEFIIVPPPPTPTIEISAASMSQTEVMEQVVAVDAGLLIGSNTGAALQAHITIASATVTPFLSASDSFLLDTSLASSLGLTATQSGGTWLVTGDADATTYEQLLQALTYKNVGPKVIGGARRITFFIQDANGATFTSATITITVIPINHAPVVYPWGGGGTLTMSEDSPPVSSTITAMDPDDDLLGWEVLCAPLRGVVTFTNNFTSSTNGTFTYTPYQYAYGSDGFVVAATDGIAQSNPVSVAVYISMVPQPPIAHEQSVTASARQTLTFNLDTSSPHGDVIQIYIRTQPEAKVLSLSGVDGPATQPGAKGVLPDGTIYGINPVTYNAAAAGQAIYALGSDTFQYQTQDFNGRSSAVATVTVTITGGGTATPPVATGQAVIVDENDSVVIALTATDAIDTDPTLMRYSISTPPTLGTVVTETSASQTNLFRYTPYNYTSGSDTFGFKAVNSNNLLSADQALVNVTIAPVNQRPILLCASGSEGILLESSLVASMLQRYALQADGIAEPNLDAKLAGAAPGALQNASAIASRAGLAKAVNDGWVAATNTSMAGLVCGGSSLWKAGMSRLATAAPAGPPPAATRGRALALLGFDHEDFASLSYVILSPPRYGTLYVVPDAEAESYWTGANGPTWLATHLLQIQRQAITSVQTVNTAGRPLFVEYIPDQLVYGSGNTTAIAVAAAKPCQACQPGTYNYPASAATTGEGQSSCMLCQQGMYNDAQAQTSCLSCPAQTYQDQAGSAACKACPDPNMISPPGAQTPGACVCKIGYFVFGQDNGGLGTCIKCSANLVCDTLNQRLPRPVKGFWVDPNNPTGAPEQCFPPEACPAYLTIGEVQAARCAVGYQGAACKFCSQGFYHATSKACEQCPGSSGWVLIVVLVAILLLVAPLLIKLAQVEAFGGVNILMAYMQANSVFRKFAFGWPPKVVTFLKMMSIVNLDIKFLAPECVVKSTNSYFYKMIVFCALPVIYVAVFAAVVLGYKALNALIRRSRHVRKLLTHAKLSHTEDQAQLPPLEPVGRAGPSGGAKSILKRTLQGPSMPQRPSSPMAKKSSRLSFKPSDSLAAPGSPGPASPLMAPGSPAAQMSPPLRSRRALRLAPVRVNLTSLGSGDMDSPRSDAGSASPLMGRNPPQDLDDPGSPSGGSWIGARRLEEPGTPDSPVSPSLRPSRHRRVVSYADSDVEQSVASASSVERSAVSASNASFTSVGSSIFNRGTMAEKVAFYFGGERLGARSGGKHLTRRFVAALLLFLSWGYFLLSSAIFDYFNCTWINGRYQLVANPGIECWNFRRPSMHTYLLPLALFGLLAYTLGIPVLFICLLRSKNKLLFHRHEIEALTRGKRRRDLTPQDSAQRTQLAMLNETCGFLYKRYEPEWYWWEVVTLSRKVLIVAASFLPHPMQQCVAILMVLVLALAALAFARPYDHDHLDIMEGIALTCNVIILFAGFLFYSELLSDRETDWVAILVVAVLVTSFVILLAFLAYDLFPKLHILARHMLASYLKKRRAKKAARAAAKAEPAALALTSGTAQEAVTSSGWSFMGGWRQKQGQAAAPTTPLSHAPSQGRGGGGSTAGLLLAGSRAGSMTLEAAQMGPGPEEVPRVEQNIAKLRAGIKFMFTGRKRSMMRDAKLVLAKCTCGQVCEWIRYKRDDELEKAAWALSQLASVVRQSSLEGINTDRDEAIDDGEELLAALLESSDEDDENVDMSNAQRVRSFAKGKGEVPYGTRAKSANRLCNPAAVIAAAWRQDGYGHDDDHVVTRMEGLIHPHYINRGLEWLALDCPDALRATFNAYLTAASRHVRKTMGQLRAVRRQLDSAVLGKAGDEVAITLAEVRQSADGAEERWAVNPRGSGGFDSLAGSPDAVRRGSEVPPPNTRRMAAPLAARVSPSHAAAVGSIYSAAGLPVPVSLSPQSPARSEHGVGAQPDASPPAAGRKGRLRFAGQQQAGGDGFGCDFGGGFVLWFV